MESETRAVLIISLPAAEEAEDGKKQWEFIAAAADAGLLPRQPEAEPQQRSQTENDTRGVLPLPLHQGPNIGSWRRRGGRFRFRMLFLLFLVSVVACAFWLRAPSFMSDSVTKEEDRDEDDAAQVFPLVYKYSGGAGAGANLSVTDSLPEFLLKRDLLRNKNRRFRSTNNNGVVRAVSKAENATSFIPLESNTFLHGLYYATLYIGDPPRPYYVDVDTGSDLTWLQCDAPCRSCSKGPHPLYSHKGPKGIVLNCKEPMCAAIKRLGSGLECQGTSQQCDYIIRYADSSSTMGVLVADVLSIRPTNQTYTRTTIVFGCGYDQQGMLATSPSPTDGLIGLGRSSISLPSQLAQRKIFKNVLGHCLAGGEGGGYMFFGDSFLPSTGITWVPMLPQVTAYVAELSGIYYGQVPATRWISSAAFDSGTTFTFLVPELYADLVAYVKASVLQTGLQVYADESDGSQPACWRGPAPFSSLEDSTKYFKPLTLRFGGSSWVPSKSKLMGISPESYLYISAGDVCLGIFESNLGVSLIGDNFLRGQLVVYDNVQSRIGWIRSKCVK